MPVEMKTHCESVDAEFDRHFGAPHSVLSADAQRHLAECDRCRKLYSYLCAPSPRVSLAPELSARIEKTLKSSLTPVKPVGSARIMAAQFFLVFTLLAFPIASMMSRAGWHLMNRGQLVGVTSVLMVGRFCCRSLLPGK